MTTRRRDAAGGLHFLGCPFSPGLLTDYKSLTDTTAAGFCRSERFESSPVDLMRWTSGVFSDMVYRDNTIMAVQAGTDTRSWHMAVTRLWQAYAIDYGVPGQST